MTIPPLCHRILNTAGPDIGLSEALTAKQNNRQCDVVTDVKHGNRDDQKKKSYDQEFLDF